MKKLNQKSNEWVFLPINKSRVVFEGEKSVLIRVGYDKESKENYSLQLPLAFKRIKESNTHIYFSFPQNFEVNVLVTKRNGKDDWEKLPSQKANIKDVVETWKDDLDKEIKK